MEINQNFEVIIPGRTVHNKIISNIKIFLENSIKVTFIANQNNLKEKYDNLEIKIIKENNISKKKKYWNKKFDCRIFNFHRYRYSSKWKIFRIAEFKLKKKL